MTRSPGIAPTSKNVARIKGVLDDQEGLYLLSWGSDDDDPDEFTVTYRLKAGWTWGDIL